MLVPSVSTGHDCRLLLLLSFAGGSRGDQRPHTRPLPSRPAEVQLKPKHQPYKLGRQWPELLLRFTDAPDDDVVAGQCRRQPARVSPGHQRPLLPVEGPRCWGGWWWMAVCARDRGGSPLGLWVAVTRSYRIFKGNGGGGPGGLRAQRDKPCLWTAL